MTLTLQQAAAVAFWAGRHLARPRPTVAPSGRWMNVDQCAAYIGRTSEAVRMLVKRGQMPHSRTGRKLQFDKERLDAWLGRHARRGAMVA